MGDEQNSATSSRSFVGAPEKRIDPNDGEAYTQSQFLECYWQLAEWNAATSAQQAIQNEATVQDSSIVCDATRGGLTDVVG